MGHVTMRICPCCAEEIKLQAKVCPRCRQWLTVRSFRHPVAYAIFLCVCLIVPAILLGLAFLSQFQKLVDPKPSYVEATGALRILQSKMDWRQTENDRRIQLVGILTNRSAVPWHQVELECRFVDTNGVMIDVAHPHWFGTVRPGDDSAFSVRVYPACPTNSYASYTLTVNFARKATGGF